MAWPMQLEPMSSSSSDSARSTALASTGISPCKTRCPALWPIGMALLAMALRILVELGSLAALLLQPAHAGTVRTALQGSARTLYFIGAPAWLLWRLLSSS